MRTLIEFDDVQNSGKWLLIWTQQNKLKKLFFSKKPRESFHPNLYFNKFVVEKVQTQKHLGLKLDKNLSFKEHLKDKFVKVNRGIGILKKLSGFLSRHSLITLYKSFMRLHLDYADILYDQPNNLNVCNKIETCHCNAALAITGAIRGSSKERLYQELRFEYLSSQRWLRKLCTFIRL